jgi:hypothetical protein
MRWVRPLLGFKSMDSARAILGGIEMFHMMRKGQAKYTHNRQPSLADQFAWLVARAFFIRWHLSVLSQTCDKTHHGASLDFPSNGTLCI